MWFDVWFAVSLQSLMEEQQSQLHQYERAAEQCVGELQKAQLQVESLQSQIHQSETSNKVQDSHGDHNIQGCLKSFPH